MKFLLTFDPISTMAHPDKAQLEVLLSPTRTSKNPIANVPDSRFSASKIL